MGRLLIAKFSHQICVNRSAGSKFGLEVTTYTDSIVLSLVFSLLKDRRQVRHYQLLLTVLILALTLRRLMSYIYGAPILDVSRSHTTTQHSR